jgi:hypothetical protein
VRDVARRVPLGELTVAATSKAARRVKRNAGGSAASSVLAPPLKALERETGVTRASIMRFVKGTQSLRLDKADRLAAFFGLELRPKRKKG